MSATWFAVGCWAPLTIWALIERSSRKQAEADRAHLRATKSESYERQRWAYAIVEDAHEKRERALRKLREMRRIHRAMMTLALAEKRPERASVLAVDPSWSTPKQ